METKKSKRNNGGKATPTIRQQRAIAGILERLQAGSNKTYQQIFIEAGYTPKTAAQWTSIMTSLRPHLQPTLDWMEMHRAQIMAQMDEKIGKADYAELTRALDVLTKNHQLLGGKPTQNLSLSSDDRTMLDALLDR